MTESKGSIGWTGEGDDQLSPGQFLREIDNKIDERNFTTEERKVKCMRNNIAYGSPADDWFSKLAVTERDTYEHLTAAFEVEWPLIATVKESKAERIRALKEWLLDPEELGKKVESAGGVQVWSHVKWANGLASRVRDAEDKSAFLLTEVYDALPEPVRDLVRREPRVNYEELATAVCSLDTKDLKDAAVRYARDEETARLAHLQSSPTKALHDALSTTHLQTPQKQYPITHPNTYINAPRPNPFATEGGRGNLFVAGRGTSLPFRGSGPGALGMGCGMQGSPARVPARMPPSQTLRDRSAATRYQDMIRYTLPQHPNTEAGRTAYNLQVTEWHRTNPHIKPDEQHPYPLTPGSVPVGSRECWGCRLPGHMSGAHVCAGMILPEPERDWRRIAGFITREYNKDRLTAAPVNYVSSQYQHVPYPHYNQYRQSYNGGGGAYLEEIDEGQGNGGGPSA
jgi:hypothetical protein